MLEDKQTLGAEEGGFGSILGSVHIKTSAGGAEGAGLMHSPRALLLADNSSTRPHGTFSFLESLFPKLGFSYERFVSPTR